MPDKPTASMEFVVRTMPKSSGGIRMTEDGGSRFGGDFYLSQELAKELGAKTDSAGKVTADVRVKVTLELAD